MCGKFTTTTIQVFSYVLSFRGKCWWRQQHITSFKMNSNWAVSRSSWKRILGLYLESVRIWSFIWRRRLLFGSQAENGKAVTGSSQAFKPLQIDFFSFNCLKTKPLCCDIQVPTCSPLYKLSLGQDTGSDYVMLQPSLTLLRAKCDFFLYLRSPEINISETTTKNAWRCSIWTSSKTSTNIQPKECLNW